MVKRKRGEVILIGGRLLSETPHGEESFGGGVSCEEESMCGVAIG